MDNGLSLLRAVARELALHSNLGIDEIEGLLGSAIDHLRERALHAIESDPQGPGALEFARQYQAVSECVLFLGAQLAALHDMEAETDGEDDPTRKN